MPDAIDFWFSTGSTYTYLTVSRLQKVEAETGVRFNWRPFSVRVLMREQQNTPFATKPIKMGYMWRDIERRAAMYGLSARSAPPAAAVRSRQSPGPARARRGLGQVLHRGELPPLVRRRPGAGHGAQPQRQPERGRAGSGARRGRSEAERIGQVYTAATDEARRLGLFGSPTFAVAGELFWGDDRLDDALTWFRHGNLKP